MVKPCPTSFHKNTTCTRGLCDVHASNELSERLDVRDALQVTHRLRPPRPASRVYTELSGLLSA